VGRSNRHHDASTGSSWRGFAVPSAVVFLPLQAGESGHPVAWQISPLTLALGAGLVVCLILVAIALALLRRHRLQIEELVARLDRVEPEKHRSGSSPAVSLEPSHSGESADDASSNLPPPSEDVLAGRTSYVEAMVEGASAESKSLSDQVILCIHDNLHRPLTPGELADELRVSLRTLQRVLAATLDCTPRQLIFAMKMRAARQQLLSGDYRVNEVAYRLGFSNPAHFSTRFRSFYRVPPSRMIRPTPVTDANSAVDHDAGMVN